MSHLEIYSRARDLAAEYEGLVPLHQLIPRTPAEADGVRACLRQLRRAGLISTGETPGYIRLG